MRRPRTTTREKPAQPGKKNLPSGQEKVKWAGCPYEQSPALDAHRPQAPGRSSQKRRRSQASHLTHEYTEEGVAKSQT